MVVRSGLISAQTMRHTQQTDALLTAVEVTATLQLVEKSENNQKTRAQKFKPTPAGAPDVRSVQGACAPHQNSTLVETWRPPTAAWRGHSHY